MNGSQTSARSVRDGQIWEPQSEVPRFAARNVFARRKCYGDGTALVSRLTALLVRQLFSHTIPPFRGASLLAPSGGFQIGPGADEVFGGAFSAPIQQARVRLGLWVPKVGSLSKQFE